MNATLLDISKTKQPNIQKLRKCCNSETETDFFDSIIGGLTLKSDNLESSDTSDILQPLFDRLQGLLTSTSKEFSLEDVKTEDLKKIKDKLLDVLHTLDKKVDLKNLIKSTPNEQQEVEKFVKDIFNMLIFVQQIQNNTSKNITNLHHDTKDTKITVTNNIITDLKQAKDIKQLFNLAKDKGIEIKQFDFFVQKTKDKTNKSEIKIVPKSEDMIKLIDTKQKNPIQKVAKTHKQEINSTLTTLLKSIKQEEIKVSTIKQKESKAQSQLKAHITTTKSKDGINILTGNMNIKSIVEKNIYHHDENIEIENKKNSLKDMITQKIDKELDLQEQDIQPQKVQASKTTHTHHDNKKVVTKTLNTFAQEFKEQVESYKPPLMKIKMQLKPVGMGEVDVTMINRGNNLHITVNSNQSTIAVFAQNQTEFKNSLVNLGFNELSMSFSEQNKKDNNQNQKNKRDFSGNFEEEQPHDSFEMITPLYV